MSSHVALPESDPESQPTSIDEAKPGFLVRNQDQVWYNPSMTQMVEAIEVHLMTHGALERLPVEYNSYVLHLVEGFAKAQKNIRELEEAYQELKQSLERNLDEFRQVADEWLQREDQYRAEVKRLEVLLSKSSQDGLEAVALARTDSIVDRSGPNGSGFRARLDKLKKNVSGTGTQDQASEGGRAGKGKETNGSTSVPMILDNNNDFLISEKIRQLDVVTKASTAASRERRERRVRQAMERVHPATNNTTRRQDGFHGHSAAVPRWLLTDPEAPSSEKGQARNEASMGRVRSRPSRHGREPLDEPGVSDTSGEATATTIHRHERGHSGFSFEAGDDCDQLPNISVGGQKDSDLPNYEQTSAHTGLETMATRRSYSHTNTSTELNPHSMLGLSDIAFTTDSNPGVTNLGGLIDGLRGVPEYSTGEPMPGKEQKPSKETDNADIRCPSPLNLSTVGQSPAGRLAQGTRDSGYNRTTVKASPSPNGRNVGTPSAAPVSGRETPKRQQAEVDARIAATLALASALGSTNQKK
ncbi:hypothetical protein F4802DRAFT_611971 [Xylaria palmicola]|nr:hypothetical protein F4802DRAFT_611971 [Xylaria palmicola]